MGKSKIMDFSETNAVYDIKVGRFNQLNEYMNLYEYQRSFTDLRPRSLSFNIFKLLLLRNRWADWSQMAPPWDVGNENLFKYSRSHDHTHTWWKTLKIFFFRTRRPMTLKLGIQHRILKCSQCFHIMTLGWPWPFFSWQGQICFRMLLRGWKLIQHWVLIYFQVCSNSAYPQAALRWAIQDQWSSGFTLQETELFKNQLIVTGQVAINGQQHLF